MSIGPAPGAVLLGQRIREAWSMPRLAAGQSGTDVDGRLGAETSSRVERRLADLSGD